MPDLVLLNCVLGVFIQSQKSDLPQSHSPEMGRIKTKAHSCSLAEMQSIEQPLGVRHGAKSRRAGINKSNSPPSSSGSHSGDGRRSVRKRLMNNPRRFMPKAGRENHGRSGESGPLTGECGDFGMVELTSLPTHFMHE